MLGVRVGSSRGLERKLVRVGKHTIATCPIARDFVQQKEQELQKLVARKSNRSGVPGFPLRKIMGSRLEKDMMTELEKGWEAHHTRPSFRVLAGLDFGALRVDVHDQRVRAEEYLSGALDSIPDGASWHAKAFRLLKIGAFVPTASPSDFLRFSCRPDEVATFNPFLSAEAAGEFLAGVSTWMQLCVLEDKIERLVTYSNSPGHLKQELQVHRNWDPRQYPSWLCFEVEARLQIRPRQASIAQRLIDNPGDIVQLNMGEGKTRVVLPMLVLHWSFFGASGAIRLHFLSALFHEAFGVLHDRLCASSFGLKLFRLPFHRQVELSGDKVAAIRDTLLHCRRVNGLVLVAPEHRLSLQLERHMVQDDELKRLLDEFQTSTFINLLDESDEILHHRYQLIYAAGNQVGLPQGPQRWRAAQALFRYLWHADESLKEVLDEKRAFSWVRSATHPEAFGTLRLLRGDTLDGLLSILRRALVSMLLRGPPYECDWMHDHDAKTELARAMLEPSEAFGAIPRLGELPPQWRDDVLAFRGFLAGDFLVHCLTKRHRVDYGVSRPGQKRLAVPFRAADTPAERAEFAHPDCALMFTMLAYYADGLSKEEFEQALSTLFSLGPNVQKVHYERWFKLSGGRMAPSERTALDTAAKLDIQNPQQLQSLHLHFRSNFETVNFFLNHCVLPVETKQYPKRLVASAWHLENRIDAIGGQTVGFSGTNDNHRLLTLHVRQYIPSGADHASDLDETREVEADLLATNGRMLDLILHKTSPGVVQLKTRPVLEMAVKRGAHCLIDRGALLAGSSNKPAAIRLLADLPERAHGVVYFADETKHWMIFDRAQRHLPRERSPVREQDCFAIFDESRCRGADLKLRSDAVALLTLGPNMCKDKLMQAAGRMRQLELGEQRLVFAATLEVITQVREGNLSNSKSVQHVLQWAMQNTVKASADGLSKWADQGAHYATTITAPSHAEMDENLELCDLYSGAVVPQDVPSLVLANQRFMVSRRHDLPVPRGMLQLLSDISLRTQEFGSEFKGKSRGLEEECERELELEIEEEEECEIEIPRVPPRAERDWGYAKILSASTPNQLSTEVVSAATLSPALFDDAVLLCATRCLTFPHS